MKANQTKTKAADPAKTGAPFFNKEAGQHYFQPIQTKLTVNGANDPLEKEADQVADRVVQKMDKGAIGRKPVFESKNESADEGVMRKVSGGGSGAGGVGSAPASVEHGLAASKGGGSGLPDGTRKDMEQAMGADLSGVRVHNDDRAHKMSNDLGAQAFAHGKDVYFNSGKFSPGAKEGKHLLAHEVAHTMQQGAVKPAVQKTDDAGANGTGTGGAAAGAGGNSDGKVLKMPDPLSLPQFKQERGNIQAPLDVNLKYKRKKPETWTGPNKGVDQKDIWKQNVSLTKVQDMLTTKLKEAADKRAMEKKPNQETLKFYYLKYNQVNLLGTPESIKERLVIPTWSKQGLASAYDVDHKKELQLRGTNEISNMELLNFSANRSAGSLINNEVQEKVATGLEKLRKDQKPGDPDVPTYSQAKKDYTILFTSTDSKSKFDKTDLAKDFWSKNEIESGEQLQKFKPMTEPEIEKASGSKEPVIYTSAGGGTGLEVNRFKSIPGITDAVYVSSPGADLAGTLTLTISPPQSLQVPGKVPVPITPMPGVIKGGSIPRQGQKGVPGLEQLLGRVDFKGLSPVDIDLFTFTEKGLRITGVIHPTLDIIEGFDLDFFVEGKEFGISKTITADDIHLPSPFSVSFASLTVGAGSSGVFVDGRVNFEIKGLGQGMIRGLGRSNGNFGIEGEFNFDKKLAKNGATIGVTYDNKAGWKIKGTLGLGDNIKGIKSGEIMVEYANGVLTADGTAQTSIKGIKEVKLHIQMGPDVTEIDGDVTIDKLPGIQKGEGHLKIIKAGDDFSFSGSGKITPDIPKVSSQIDFSFHDDVFSVDATLDYVNDRLSGSLHVGITNQDVDDEGKPKKGKGKGDFTVFGGGQMTLKITDNIIATAGVNLKPDGDIEIMGEIKLPERFEVVPALLNIQNKELIPIPEIHIPLFGIPLGVKTIGLEATIAPKLTASVQLGPGSLTNVGAGVKYTLSQPDSLEITGAADFEFIAKAGITAGVDFKVDVDAGIAEVGGGVNISAFIEAAAEQPVFHTDIKYSPKTGFELNGDVKAMVKAMLGFSGSLFLEATLGVSFLSKTWRWDKPLFKKEIDTGAEIGFEFPFSYKDGKGNADFDNLKFKYPTFNKGLLNRIKEAVIDPVKDEIFGDD